MFVILDFFLSLVDRFFIMMVYREVEDFFIFVLVNFIMCDFLFVGFVVRKWRLLCWLYIIVMLFQYIVQRQVGVGIQCVECVNVDDDDVFDTNNYFIFLRSVIIVRELFFVGLWFKSSRFLFLEAVFFFCLQIRENKLLGVYEDVLGD